MAPDGKSLITSVGSRTVPCGCTTRTETTRFPRKEMHITEIFFGWTQAIFPDGEWSDPG